MKISLSEISIKKKELDGVLTNLLIDSADRLVRGKDQDTFDLCTLQNKGTNMFCAGNKNIPRSDMPQLKGEPMPGTEAAKLEVSKNNKVDATKAFLKHLKQQGIRTKKYSIDCRNLKASQNQIVGLKVAINVAQMKKDPNHKKFDMNYFVSKDGYILDGHHGWASVLSYSIITKQKIDVNVIEVDMKIKPLIEFTNNFCNSFGIKRKTATVKQ